LGFSALVALSSGLLACGIGDFALLGTREVMDDLFSEYPLRENANPKLHQRSRWDQRAGGVGASLALFVIFTFFYSALCIGLPVSNGLVTPSFAIGAGIGRLVGEALRTLTTSATGECPLSPAGGYAIVGAAAFSVSVTGKLSIGVVISELTDQLSYSIPVLFACVVGLGAGQLVETDIYTMIAILKALPHWPALSSAASFSRTVNDIVDTTKPYEEPCLALIDDQPPTNVQDALTSATHVVIPAVRNGVFVGVMRVADLASALEGDFAAFIDDAWPRCQPAATLSHLCFLFDLHHKDRVFVVHHGGRLVGHVDASQVGRALSTRAPAETAAANPLRAGRRVQLRVGGSGHV